MCRALSRGLLEPGDRGDNHGLAGSATCVGTEDSWRGLPASCCWQSTAYSTLVAARVDVRTRMDEAPVRETLGFQAEVKQLLHLMIHSLYGNKEIFLRELVSNASDAADKLRFEAMTDATLFENDHDLRIRVGVDPAARTITVSDNGIGMSRPEVIE